MCHWPFSRRIIASETPKPFKTFRKFRWSFGWWNNFMHNFELEIPLHEPEFSKMDSPAWNMCKNVIIEWPINEKFRNFRNASKSFGNISSSWKRLLWQHSPKSLKASRWSSLAVHKNPRCAESGSEPAEHSAWNRSRQGILWRAGVTSEAGISFPEPESEPLKTLPVSLPYRGCGAGVGAGAFYPGPESEPSGHLTQSRNPSYSGYFPGLRSRSLSRNYLNYWFSDCETMQNIAEFRSKH